MSTTDLLLVRHGETASNIHGLLHGRTDVPLTTLGELQAKYVARRIVRNGSPHALYSSPLTRAIQTATEIARATRLEINIVENLAELDFGDLEGLTYQQLHDLHPELFARLLDPLDYDVMLPNGERRYDFHERVRSSIDEIIRQHREEQAVIVAHGGVIGSGIAQLTGGEPNDIVRYLVKNCSVTHLRVESSGRVEVECLNDVEHLAELDVEEVGE